MNSLSKQANSTITDNAKEESASVSEGALIVWYSSFKVPYYSGNSVTS